MKRLQITQFGNPILRQKAKPLSVARIRSAPIKKMIRDMFHTMDGIGVGLAAPQVGISLQLAVLEVISTRNRATLEAFPKTVIINPKITKYSTKTEMGLEGCLSCSNSKTGDAIIWGQVPRARTITIKYIDEHGKSHTETYEGFTARVFQHEVDHLNGILFVDRMNDMKTLSVTDELHR